MTNDGAIRKGSQESDTGRFYRGGAVRTRGFISVSAPPETGGGPIRGRRAVHTRGKTEASVMEKPWQVLECRDLGELFEEVRNAQDRFPITIVVENPSTDGGKMFLHCVYDAGLLGSSDILWVLGEGSYEEIVSDKLQSYVQPNRYLNIERKGESGNFGDGEDRLRATILLPDLVFVADADGEKLKEKLKKWEASVWAVILDGPRDFDPAGLDLKLGIEKKPDWLRRWAG